MRPVLILETIREAPAGGRYNPGETEFLSLRPRCNPIPGSAETVVMTKKI